MHQLRTGLRRQLLTVAIANACAAALFATPAAFAQGTNLQSDESRDTSATLPTLQVTESRLYDSLPAPYAGGQVATSGRLGLLGNTGIMNAPFNITSYTSDLIKSQQARSIADIIDNDPSVQSSLRGRGTNTGGDGFNIRGFTLFNSDISLNGMYGVMPLNTISMETVERVEIIKGPNTLLNGVW